MTGSRAVASWLIAGAVGQLALMLTIRGVLPAVFGTTPPPAALVRAVFGMQSQGVAIAVHLLLTVVVLPVAYVWVGRPLGRAVVPDLPWWLSGGLFGAIVCVAALASLIAGPALEGELGGFTLAIWPGLTAHVIYGVVMAGVLQWRGS